EEGAVEGRAGGAFPTELRSCRSPATTPAPQPVISPPQRCPRGERKLKNVHLSSHPHDGTAGFVNSPPFNPLKDRTSRPGVGGGLKMTQQKGTLLLAAMLVAGIPATASGQQPQHGGGGRPAAAPHFAPAPGMAAPQMPAPRMPAPHMSSPRMSALQIAPRMAQPRMQPRMATPHVNAPRMATPHIQRPPAVSRTVQRQQFRQERPLRQQTQPSAQVRSNVQTRTKQQQLQANTQINSRDQLRTTREQQRAERTLRRSEARELRQLPPPQRPARREQFDQARQQRALA